MKKLIAVAAIVLALSPVALAQPVHFDDASLKAAVETALGVTDPTASDMLGLTRFMANMASITDLTGLEALSPESY